MKSNLTVIARVLAATLGVFAIQTGALAAVSQGDDVVFGSNAVIVDDVNHSRWLRLDFTTPYTYNDVVGLLGTTFAGWSIASTSQLLALGSSAGIVHGSTDASVVAKAEQLRDWFCFTCVETSSTHIYARGLVSDTQVIDIGFGPHTVQDAFSIGRRLNTDPDEADFRVSGWYYPDAKLSPNEGIFLVQVVPEPETYALFFAGLGLLGAVARRQAKSRRSS